MAFVLLVAVKVKGRPLGEVAVTGMMSDLPAGTLTLLSGSMTGAATAGSAIKSVAKRQRKKTLSLILQNIFTTGQYEVILPQKTAKLKFFSQQTVVGAHAQFSARRGPSPTFAA